MAFTTNPSLYRTHRRRHNPNDETRATQPFFFLKNQTGLRCHHGREFSVPHPEITDVSADAGHSREGGLNDEVVGRLLTVE